MTRLLKWITIAAGVSAMGWTASAQLTATRTADAAVVEPKPIPCPPEPIRRNYNVANPRVSLSARPLTATDAVSDAAGCSTVGAAHNFNLNHGRIVVRKGTHLNVKISDDVEGVWYERACGILGVYIQVQAYDAGNRVWRNVGANSRAARLCGPVKGSACNIGVVFKANTPGDFLLRARVISFALPLRPDLVEPDNLRSLLACGDADFDDVYLKVRVIGHHLEPSPVDLAWEAAEADAVEAEPARFEDTGGVNLLDH